MCAETVLGIQHSSPHGTSKFLFMLGGCARAWVCYMYPFLEHNCQFHSTEGQGWETIFASSHLLSIVCWWKVLFHVPDPFISGWPKSISTSQRSLSRPILFILNSSFVSTRFIDLMVVCARLNRVASDFIERAMGGSTASNQMGWTE